MATDLVRRRRRPRAATRPAIALRRANLQLRFLAWLIDVVFVSFVADSLGRPFVQGPLGDVLRSLITSTPTDANTQLAMFYWVSGTTMLAIILICAVLIVVPALRLLRATPGQRLMGLMTVGAETGRLGLAAAVVRVFILFLPWAGVASFGFLTGLGDQTFQGSTSVDILRIVPWIIRAAALAWYAVLAISIGTAEQGRGLLDRATDAVVVRRLGA